MQSLTTPWAPAYVSSKVKLDVHGQILWPRWHWVKVCYLCLTLDIGQLLFFTKYVHVHNIQLCCTKPKKSVLHNTCNCSTEIQFASWHFHLGTQPLLCSAVIVVVCIDIWLIRIVGQRKRGNSRRRGNPVSAKKRSVQVEEADASRCCIVPSQWKFSVDASLSCDRGWCQRKDKGLSEIQDTTRGSYFSLFVIEALTVLKNPNTSG